MFILMPPHQNERSLEKEPETSPLFGTLYDSFVVHIAFVGYYTNWEHTFESAETYV